MNNNSYRSAMEHLKFNEAFDEQTIALMLDATQRKKTIRPFRIPRSSWRYIAAAAVIALLFIAVPLIRGPQNTNETTIAAAITAAGYETTVQSETASNNTTAMTASSTDVFSPGTIIEDGTMYISSTTSRMESLSTKELANVSDNIFTCICVSSEPVFQNNIIYTKSTVNVTEVFKGSLKVGDLVSVVEMGGRTTIGEYSKNCTVEEKSFITSEDSIPSDLNLVQGADGYFPLKVDENVLLFATDDSGFIQNFSGPLYSLYADYEGKMYFKNDNVYARNTPSNTDIITFDDTSASISLDELKLLIEDSK